MNDTLSRLIHAARQAIDRGDLYVGMVSDFYGVAEWARMMDIPVGLFEGRVLLKLKSPRRALNTDGEIVAIVSHHAGAYYGLKGDKYTINELAFLEDKRLP